MVYIVHVLPWSYGHERFETETAALVIPFSLKAILKTSINMADEDDIAALVIDNGSGMCKGTNDLSMNWLDRWAAVLFHHCLWQSRGMHVGSSLSQTGCAAGRPPDQPMYRSIVSGCTLSLETQLGRRGNGPTSVHLLLYFRGGGHARAHLSVRHCWLAVCMQYFSKLYPIIPQRFNIMIFSHFSSFSPLFVTNSWVCWRWCSTLRLPFPYWTCPSARYHGE